jgi:hypothetical protein
MSSNINLSPRLIRRNSAQVILRDKTYVIHGLSIANLEKLKQSITGLLDAVFQKVGDLQQQNGVSYGYGEKRFFTGMFRRKKKSATSTETLNFIDDLLNSILKEPLVLLESASGLPHELFDPAQPEKCLAIEEIKQLAEVVFEVNGLDFVWTALKQLGSQMIESIQKKPSVPSASGTDIPLLK